MFLFGHIGITLGIFMLLKMHPSLSKIPIDLRLVVLGSILPDLIDKPLKLFIFADSMSSGRTYGHTLLFCLLLFLGAFYLWKKKNNSAVLVIPVASFLHLIQDRMWKTPETLLWPLMGWEFPKGSYSPSIIDYFLNMFTNSYTPAAGYVFTSELLGILILGIAGIYYIRKYFTKKP